jgi:hypothetical protein
MVVGLLGVLACSKASEPAARGSLVFEPQPEATASVFLATEAEVIRSASLREHIQQDLHTEIAADAIVVTRTPDSMILEVAVRDADPRRAAELCNAVLRGYIDRRRESANIEIVTAQQALAAELDRHPADARLQERMKELELARSMLKSDVRVLDACRAATASRR